MNFLIMKLHKAIVSAAGDKVFLYSAFDDVKMLQFTSS
jgi:hypothetical protein